MMAVSADATEGMDYLERLPRRVFTLYLPLAVFLFVLLFPFYWMTTTTFKPDDELYDYARFDLDAAVLRRSDEDLGCHEPVFVEPACDQIERVLPGHRLWIETLRHYKHRDHARDRH